MKRKPLPKYGATPRGLTPERVHIARTSGASDTSLARQWGCTDGAVRRARVGISWTEHPTPPDTKPRLHGRYMKKRRPEPLNISRALAAMKPPSLDDSKAEHA